MERSEVSKKIRTILNEEKTLPEGALDDGGRSLEDLGFDSLDALNIIFAIEEEFDITVDDDEARSLRTIDQLVDAVMLHLESEDS
ncbi:MAG: acyl carrier protein [Thermoanaerobaculia bacterium]|nr:acyl carrier protein [Thermoanaerobaculia bacterium]